MKGSAMSPVALTLAEHAVAFGRSPLADEARHHARRCVLDWFAALLPGTRLPPATTLMSALEDELGRGPASLPGTGRRASPRAAALINGAASHIVEFDDIFRDGLYHPGCPTIAAALAAIESRGGSGDDLLRAVVAGYEVSTRIAAAIQPAHYRFWHTTGTVGCFGAAVAAAVALRLERDRSAHAIGTVGTFAAGLQQAFRSDSMSKPLHAGRAAEAGVLAATGAACGLTGALDILEGPAGFGAAMAGEVDWAKATDGLGERYNIAHITVKNHGCCGHTFAAIDGALELARAHAIEPEAIRSVTVGTYRVALDVTGSHRAGSPAEARFSLPYVVAHALTHGSVRLDAFTALRLADPRVQALLQKVRLEVDAEAEAAFPTRRSALITIEQDDGRTYSYRQPTRKGDPDAPLSDDELCDKFMELARPVIGEPAAVRLLERLWRLGGDEPPLDLAI